MSGVASLTMMDALGLAFVYLLFWVILCGLTSRLRWSSVANAATLAAAWLILVLILPTLANVLVNRAIPVAQDAEIALTQRTHRPAIGGHDLCGLDGESDAEGTFTLSRCVRSRR